MKKNGFTLIELLAVIVILAIIALIAIPIILGIINDAREKAYERSVELYASAVRNAVASYQLTHPNAPTKFTDLDVQYDGEVECAKEELYADGSFYIGDCTVNETAVDYTYGLKLCTPNTEKAKALVWQQNGSPHVETNYEFEEVGLLASIDGAYTPGVAYTCNFGETEDSKNLTFYVLSSTETAVTLIAGFNLGSTVAWYEHEEDSKYGPQTANNALVDRTSEWKKLTVEQKSTISLPTVNQILYTYSDSDDYYEEFQVMPKWLISYSKKPISNGYWTSTDDHIDNPSLAYAVDTTIEYGDGYVGDFYLYYVIESTYYGVRPVITLSKTDI